MRDRDYELGMLSTLLKQQNLMKYANRLTEYHFVYPWMEDYLKVFKRCWKKHSALPNLPEMHRLTERALLKKNTTPEDLEQAALDIEDIYGGEPTASTTEEMINFVTERELQALGADLAEADLTATERAQAVSKLEVKARELKSLAGHVTDLGEQIFMPGQVSRSLDEMELAMGDLSVPTGWKRMDEVNWGGMAPSEVYAVMGASNLGKSAIAVNMSKHALLLEPDGKRFIRRKRVLHLSTDDSPVMYKMRFYSSITNTPTKKPHKADKYERLIAEAIPDIEGRHYLKFIPNQTWTAADIEAWIIAVMDKERPRDLKRGIDPKLAGRADLVIIDYAEKLKMDGNANDPTYQKYLMFMEQMQRIALTFNIVIVVMTQGNSSMAQTNFGQLFQGAGGYDKCKPLTGCWIICQEDEGRLATPMEFWLYQAKDRRGEPSRLFPMCFDVECQVIYENERVPISRLSSHTKGNRAKPIHDTDGKAAAEHNKNSVAKVKENPHYQPDHGEPARWKPGQKKKTRGRVANAKED